MNKDSSSQNFPKDQFSNSLSGNKKSSGWIFKAIFFVGVGGTLLVILGVVLAYSHFSRGLPKIISVADYRPLGVTRILGSDGKEEIGEFFKERRYLIPYDKIPEHVVRAFISAEDDRFFEHPGINIISMIRAGIANFKAGHVVQGGSTITQQVAKSLLLTSERSFDRKIKEIILASRFEQNLTKQQILYLYLNQIYLGHGAYGVQSASKTYFQKDISEITIAEAALLAGMPQAPGKYSPLLNPKRAKERQLYVLRRMYENKYITQSQMTQAAGQTIKIFRDEDLNNKYAPYYVEFIRKYLVEKYGEKAVFEDGLTVTIPGNKDLNLVAKKSLVNGLLAVDKRIGFRGPIQHLSGTAEIEKFLQSQRVQLIEKKVPFQLFMPNGKMDPIEAMRVAGVQSESDLLVPGELYQGVVINFDTAKKSARIMIGAVRADLPASKMKWALPAKSDQNAPSKILKIGDVIWVSLDPSQTKELQVSLEQEPQIEGSLFSMDVKSGKVLAMVGGYDFNRSEFNRAIQANRQPGSAFKPIIYASALEKGFTPASIIVDSPIVFKDSDGMNSWKPNNFESKFYGDTTFRQALIKSRNIPTVKIVQAVQVPNLINFAKRLGMNGQFSSDLSISLGSGAVSLMELTKTYALFPRLGRKVDPIFFDKIVDRDGRILEEHAPKPIPSVLPTPIADQSSPIPSPTASGSELTALDTAPRVVLPNYPLPDDPDQVLDPRVAYVMTHLMKEVVTFGTGHEAKNLGRPAAGKTGTTNDSIDAWFMGFTPDVATGVWVGYDSQKSIGSSETGAKVALPIWLSFMKDAVKSYPESDFSVPPGVVFANIDPNSGKPVSSNSSYSIKEAFIDGTQPTHTTNTETKDSEIQSEFFKEDKE